MFQLFEEEMMEDIFVEEYKGKTMYPAVFKVFYEEISNEVTEEDYQRWLKGKSKVIF